MSLGCGLGPPVKRERSVSTVLDTGNVLIESACSTDRVDEAVATLLSLQPSIKYFRCVCVCVCLLYAYNLCVCVCHYAYMCGCACMYVYAFVCVCVCVCGGGVLKTWPGTHTHLCDLLDAPPPWIQVPTSVSDAPPSPPGSRFQPVDERCNMELDEIDPSLWSRLQEAAREYSLAHSARCEQHQVHNSSLINLAHVPAHSVTCRQHQSSHPPKPAASAAAPTSPIPLSPLPPSPTPPHMAE